jgi:cytochrome P450
MGIDPRTSILDPEINQDPFPYFNAIREDQPLHWNERHRAWFVTRYEDVRNGLRDPGLSVDRVGPYFSRRVPDEQKEELRPAFDVLGNFLSFLPPPRHTRLRKIVQKAFTPKIVANQSELIDRVTAGLAASVTERLREGQTVDLVTEFARPLPARITAEMVHLDPSDIQLVEKWTQDLAMFMGGAVEASDRNDRIRRGVSSMTGYLEGVIRNYQGSADGDFVGALLAADDEGVKLTPLEILSTCVLVVFGGYRTTACSIANAARHLIENPDMAERLRQDDALVDSAIEEFMRYEGHARVVVRWAGQDTVIQGQRIPQGDRIFLIIAAANRDPRQFERPDELILDRAPNPHLGFGTGIHYCLGAPISRIEQRSALRAFLSGVPHLSKVEERLYWEELLTNRALKKLEVTLDPVTVG